MRKSLRANRATQSERLYLTREPAIIALLSTAVVVCFAAVSGLSSMYHAQHQALGTHWFVRGAADLKERRFERAATEFRTALLYSRDNYSYQFDLAEALLGQKYSEQASPYLSNLWDREPANGLVNLELARIAGQNGETEGAVRFYHNAIYAAWQGDHEAPRQEARLELISYLLKIHDKPQAQSELIALAANLDNDASREIRVADLFVAAEDYSDALTEYRLGLKNSPRNPAALRGAGQAALELGLYRTAQQYLQAAVAADSSDRKSAALLQTADLVLQMDPFRQIASAGRDRLIAQAFAVAGDRLQSCSQKMGEAAKFPQPLSDQWAKMKPRVSERGLRRDPLLPESAMELVFEIERQAGAACGPPTPADEALLRIWKLHEAN